MTIVLWLFSLVGALGIARGFGSLADTPLHSRIAVLIGIAFVYSLLILGCGLFGALDNVEVDIFTTVWLFVVTPLASSSALIGIGISADFASSWLNDQKNIFVGKIRSLRRERMPGESPHDSAEEDQCET